MHSSRFNARILSAVTAAAAAMALTACGTSDGGAAVSPSGSDVSTSGASSGMTLDQMKADLASYTGLATSYPEVAPVADAASLKGKTVWWVPFGPAVGASFGPAITQALGKLGISLKTCDGKFLPTAVAACLESAASQGADAVITGYVDYKAIPTAYESLASKGIPVLLAGATNNSGKPQSATFAFIDTTAALKRYVQSQLEGAIVDGDGKANILWVGLADSAQLGAITDYAQSFVTENCPDCSFEKITTNSASLNKLASQVGAALTQNPDTDHVVVQADPAVPAVIQAVQTVGSSSIKVTGGGGLPDVMTSLQSGQGPLMADSGLSLAYEGWAFSHALVQMMTGTAPADQAETIYRYFTPENVKDLSITPAAFTSMDWYADSAAVEATFTSAWGIG
jgi:ribose transport system substrate-binding protein